jgi:hypothetical protein
VLLYKIKTHLKEKFQISASQYLSFSIRKKTFLNNNKIDTRAFVEVSFTLYSLLSNTKFKKCKDFGIFQLESQDLAKFENIFNDAPQIKIGNNSNPNYFSSPLNENQLLLLNENNSYKDGNYFKLTIDSFIDKYREYFQSITNAPFRVVNIRAWEMLPNKSSFGPSDWHKDGFAPGHAKIMVYLSELSQTGGTIQIHGLEPLQTEPGTVFIFRNSDLLHRAIPGTFGRRKLIEITIQLLIINVSLPSLVGECNDRHLLDPLIAHK